MISNKYYTFSDKILAVQTYTKYAKPFYNNYSVKIDGDHIYSGRVYVYDESGTQEVSIYLNDILYRATFANIDISNMNFNPLNVYTYAKNVVVEFEPYEDASGKMVLPDVIAVSVIPAYDAIFNRNFNIDNLGGPFLPLNGVFFDDLGLNYRLLPTIPYMFIGKDYSFILANLTGNTITHYALDYYWCHKHNKAWKPICEGLTDFTIYPREMTALNIPVEATVLDASTYTLGIDKIEPMPISICNVDNCPATYYLIWQDAYGGRQCLPFGKIDTKSESYTYTNKIDKYNESSPIRIKLQNKIKINSDLISEDKLPYYESIFTSKNVILYETKNDQFYRVMVDDKQFTYKTLKNLRKLFNLTLNLTIAETQNIIY